MNSSDDNSALDVQATNVAVNDETLTVDLEDGRTIAVPVIWYPRLKHGTPSERAKYEISGLGIHWPQLDEDISVSGLLRGEKSQENPRIIKWWLQQRARGKRASFEDYMKQQTKVVVTRRQRVKKAG